MIDNPNETKDYEIVVDFKKKSQLKLKGSYDKYGLPEDWPEFAEQIVNFIRFYDFAEILDPSVYRKAKRRANDYMFCSVEFEEGGKSYYYISQDDTIEIGDLVIVPTRKDEHTQIVEVVDVNFFSKEDAPFPVEKTKYIIGKYMKEN